MKKSNEEFDVDCFRIPESNRKPVYTWIWNGKVTRDSIKEQMDSMKRRDIHNFYILPEPPTFRPNSMYSELNIPYMSEEYLGYVRFAAEYAKMLGMTMWLYDEPGWPSGNAGNLVVQYDKKVAFKWIDMREYTLKKGEQYHRKEDVVAAFGTERIDDGFQSKCDVLVTEYFLNSTRETTRADLVEAKAVDRFIECTYEKYKDILGDLFGNQIPCIFTDEPSLISMKLAWPYDFQDRFAEMYGYDICKYLPALVSGDIRNEEDRRASIHYYELISKLFSERYFETLHSWCRENNIKFVGHINQEHEIRDLRKCKYGYLMRVLRKFDIPGIDVISRQIYPDKNPCKVGYGFFPRLASSAAAQNGGKDALSESFAVYGSGLSIDSMRYVINYQAIRGINIFNFMVMSNGEKGFLNSQERPYFIEEMPQSLYYMQLHNYIARLSYLLTLGENMADTALYIPVRDILAGGEYEEQASADFEQKGYELEKRGIDFDLIDDTVIWDANKKGCMLEVGLAKYRNIIIPECRYMPADIQKKLEGIHDSVQSNLIEGTESLRTKKRLLANGNIIILIFNESIEDVISKVNFPKKNHLYELDLTSGDLIACEYDKEIHFFGGELKSFLISEQEMPARRIYKEVNKRIIDDFVAAPVSVFRIQKDGIQKKCVQTEYQKVKLGAWENIWGKEFSGEISYRTELEVDCEPGKKFCIELGRVDVAARIRINDRDYGFCTLSPKKILVPYEEMPKGKVQLEIIVTNTAANQYVYGDYEKYYSGMEKGDYHRRCKSFEESEVGGGLYGPVTISLLV